MCLIGEGSLRAEGEECVLITAPGKIFTEWALKDKLQDINREQIADVMVDKVQMFCKAKGKKLLSLHFKCFPCSGIALSRAYLS